ncbi:hypothetical protein HRR77_008365 [Exophiala dermatitidis]|nr:hypothetical protein HRR77_008365 [Exophiala dermatitidis]KAJ9002340.1 hypothetical protein HRR94_008665 [Exophiala dermatitidis]
MMPAHDHTSRVTFSVPTVTIDPETGYFVNIDEIRDVEYPALAETTYLDHAGTTLYAKSLIDSYSRELTSKLFGNPHSASASSQLSSRRIDDYLLQTPLPPSSLSEMHFETISMASDTGTTANPIPVLWA